MVMDLDTYYSAAIKIVSPMKRALSWYFSTVWRGETIEPEMIFLLFFQRIEIWGPQFNVWPRWVFLVIDSCSDFVGPLLTPLRCRQQKFPKDTHPEATKDLFIIILSMKAFDFSEKKVWMSKNFMRDFWIIEECLSFIRISWMWKYRKPDVSWLKEDSYKVYCRGWSDLLF